MKHYRSLLLLPFVLTGCATTDMQGALDSLNGLGAVENQAQRLGGL